VKSIVRSPRVALIVALLGVAGVSSVLAANETFGGVEPPDVCAASEAHAPLVADLTLPSARLLWDHFPDLGRPPLLTEMGGPIRVVAFSGARDGVPIVARPGTSTPPLVNVVCIVDPDGEEWYFNNVPLDSYRP
jgi:hypothetical protein